MMKVLGIFEKIKHKPQKLAIIGVLCLVLIAMLFVIISRGSGRITVRVENSLKEVLETSEISTVEYTYNSIAEKKEDGEGEKVKYYVKYNGVVKAGFDFDKLDVSKDEHDESKMVITIPEIRINSVAVNEDLKYIFTKEKYNTEIIYPEAFKLCSDDLTSKAKKNGTLKNMAKESAEELIRGLVAPFEEDGYSIEIVHTTEEGAMQ